MYYEELIVPKVVACVLGLIHANHGTTITDYLHTKSKDAQNEMTCHWSCLGLSLAATGSLVDI
ncbi:26S proteasome non-ATPase regulatory subunit 1-like [Bombus fervidus]|uniref:26S proteasome non-ATPase regulatory subunit 1-like n=1 Tax=Bombus fervidus TaxID=203811 RepID=UPI003D18A2AE